MKNPFPSRLHGTRWLRSVLCIAVVLLAACGRPVDPPGPAVASGEVRTFTGNWTMTGNRQIMTLDTGRQAGIFKLTGSLLLTGKQRLTAGFKAEVVGFSDTATGMTARSVWTDERGDKVFSELRGESVVPGTLIEGRFVGGTGRYAGVSGDYTFRWQRLADAGDGDVSGRVVGLEGSARLATVAGGNGK